MVPGILDGVRVIDMGHFVAVPSAAVVLGDWGADVIKVEPLAGEPQRGVMALASTPVNWRFEVHNRNKKSLALDLKTESGKEVLHRLAVTSDVFMSNYQAAALRAMEMDYVTLSRLNPGLVYGLVTAYGTSGPDRERRGFDLAAAWAGSGIQHLLAESDGPPPQQRGGMMDRTAGFHLVAGILAALLNRGKTGEGQLVECSLYHSGVWTLAAGLQVSLGGLPLAIHDRSRAVNPLVNTYRTADGRWVQLAMLQSDLSWHDFCLALDRTDLENDERFGDMLLRAEHCEELVTILDGVFASKTVAEWEKRLLANDCIFSRVRTPEEVITDPQAIAAGFFAPVEHPTVGETHLIATPVSFRQRPATVRTAAPEVGQHTEELLIDLGYSWEDIARLKEMGVIL